MGRQRVIIDRVAPCVDRSRFPVKRVIGESVVVRADLIADGHDQIAADVLYRKCDQSEWQRAPLRLESNDRWTAEFEVDALGPWEYSIEAWIDRFGTWRSELEKKAEAGLDVELELKAGALLVRAASEFSGIHPAARTLDEYASRLTGATEQEERIRIALLEHLRDLMRELSPRPFITQLDRPVPIIVERPKALFSAWYELFPRSLGATPDQHGTFTELIAHLPYVADMGFDVLYLPPIHPIGKTFRKGPNNSPQAGPTDPGSPWAIGSREGGHTAIHPELGSFQDFDRLVAAAQTHGLELALDIAFQCSPDHPWVTEHPEWFRHRPDGTIQYAENPPKKYQDIYPVDFESDQWQSLWKELRGVFTFWIDRGVRIFRVDNPHTKSFRFWDWVIPSIQQDHPDVIFLSEAFTRPKRMYRLAKGGFTQSYTYFAWRNGPIDIEQYMHELVHTEVIEHFRPNFWPNTPDILTEYLQQGGRPAALARLVLAATLSSNYGIYGPAFELCECTPREPGSEEYLHSEKYQLRSWNLEDPWSLRHLIKRVNEIRRSHPALQQMRQLQFHRVDNPALIAYSKRSSDWQDVILCVVSTNPHEDHWGTVHLDLGALGLGADECFDVVDLLAGARYTWQGAQNQVGLGPGLSMAHIFRIVRHGRDETNFEYFD